MNKKALHIKANLRKFTKYLFLISFFFLPLFSFQILQIRFSENPGYERVVIEGESPFTYIISSEKDYLNISILNAGFSFSEKIFDKNLIKKVSWDQNLKELKIYYNKPNLRYVSFTLSDPFRLVIDFSESLQKDSFPKDEKDPTGKGISENIKDFTKGEKSPPQVVVIDPGHGGAEEGAIGSSGTKEKNVVFAISKKLKYLIEQRAGIKAVLTREGDEEKTLDERVSIANNMKASLFLSIHTNASLRKNAKGSEVYFLSLNATDEDAKRLSQIENLGADIEDNSDLKLILWDMAQSLYLKESSTLAELIQNELNSIFETKGRGVKQAPFKVLMGVASPAVLVEVAFITNPEEEKKLKSNYFQERIAEAIYRGILKFLRQRDNR